MGTCAMVKSRYIGDGHPTFNRNPYNGYIIPYYWVDDHPLLYGNNGSLDPGTHGWCGSQTHMFLPLETSYMSPRDPSIRKATERLAGAMAK